MTCGDQSGPPCGRVQAAGREINKEGIRPKKGTASLLRESSFANLRFAIFQLAIFQLWFWNRRGRGEATEEGLSLSIRSRHLSDHIYHFYTGKPPILGG